MEVFLVNTNCFNRSKMKLNCSVVERKVIVRLTLSKNIAYIQSEPHKMEAKTGKVKLCLEYTGLGSIQPECKHYHQ